MMKRLTLSLIVLLALALPAIAFSAGQPRISLVDATSWIKGDDPWIYSPDKMIDGDETTAFQFSTSTTPIGQEYVYFYLSSPADIDTLWIKNGFWKITGGYDQYTRNSRVRAMTVDFQYSGYNGYYDALDVYLPDDTRRSGWMEVNLGLHTDVTGVRFLIWDIYQGSKFPSDVCISEVKFSSGSSSSSSMALYGQAREKLATRSGPGTQYEDMGTYNVAGEYIKVLSRAWDSRNGIWWVKCEIPYGNETRVLWTGYKRFYSSTLPLEDIPIE